MYIKINNLTQKYDNFIAINNLNLELEKGKLTALLGPSGCGKTTLLKTIAGLLPLYKGSIILNNKDISNLVPQKRNTAMVFQNYALFPNMTVEENIEYGLKVKKIDKITRKELINDIISKVKLENQGNKKIQELSGGQQQRVALARALVIEPDVLLLDEPLSNLDEKLRVDMRKEIRRIQKYFNITSIYVTHDQQEAMAIADKVVIMNEGEIHQISTPNNAYLNPKTKFVAQFMGNTNIFNIKDPNIKKVFSFIKLEDNEYSYLVIRPESIDVVKESFLKGKIISLEYLGPLINIEVILKDNIKILVSTLNNSKHKFGVGQTISLNIDYENIILLKN